jgi:hypothetical protein
MVHGNSWIAKAGGVKDTLAIAKLRIYRSDRFCWDIEIANVVFVSGGYEWDAPLFWRSTTSNRRIFQRCSGCGIVLLQASSSGYLFKAPDASLRPTKLLLLTEQ